MRPNMRESVSNLRGQPAIPAGNLGKTMIQ